MVKFEFRKNIRIKSIDYWKCETIFEFFSIIMSINPIRYVKFIEFKIQGNAHKFLEIEYKLIL